MSGMHLLPPMYSTTGKKRTKRKWESAEQKRQAMTRQDEWNRKLVQFDKMSPKFSTGPYNAPRKTMADFLPKTPPGRETPRIESQDTGWVTCTAVKDNEYTGDAVIGIAQMAKSNAVPVFDSNHIVEIARMRR